VLLLGFLLYFSDIFAGLIKSRTELRYDDWTLSCVFSWVSPIGGRRGITSLRVRDSVWDRLTFGMKALDGTAPLTVVIRQRGTQYTFTHSWHYLDVCGQEASAFFTA